MRVCMYVTSVVKIVSLQSRRSVYRILHRMQDYIEIRIIFGTNMWHKMKDYIGIHITLDTDMRHKMQDYIGICIIFMAVCSLSDR